MGRYARAIYGQSKYGLDLRSEFSCEPMLATLEVDRNLMTPLEQATGSAFTNDRGEAVYSRVQVSWIAPMGFTRFVLLRSNLGFPTGPTDPYARALIDGADMAGATAVAPLPGDPINRQRYAFLDANVEQGREYFYAAWCMTGDVANNTDEWHLAGRVMTTTSTDHGLLDTFKGALPPYMWNQYVGPGIGVAVMDDADNENTMTRWLQSSAWELDKTLTKADLLRQVWDPQRTPAILLDDAVSMFGLPVEPALGDRAARALLSNAADITGERGTLNSIGLLVESLSGISCELTLGGNRIPSTDESSFEGLMVAPGTQTVTGGTGRWFITNAALTRVDGDASNADVYVARDPNPDEKVGPGKRFGLRLDSVNHALNVSMTLGEKVRVTALKSDAKAGTVTTQWAHGLESGDVVNLCINGSTAYPVKVLWTVDDFKFQFDAAGANAALKNQDLTGITNGWITGGPVPAHQGVPVNPEKTYALVGMFEAANAQNFTLKVKYWDRQGNLLSTTTASPAAPVPSAPWTRVYASGSSPAGAVAATLEITLTQTGAPQYLSVDSLMVKEGGTRYDGVISPTEVLPYESSTKYEGDIDYTFEDALLLTITFDTTKTPAGGPIPFTIQGDLAAVLSARLTDILTRYLPIGTAFRLEGLTPQEV